MRIVIAGVLLALAGATPLPPPIFADVVFSSQESDIGAIRSLQVCPLSPTGNAGELVGTFYASVGARSCLECDLALPLDALLCRDEATVCAVGKVNNKTSLNRCDVDCPAGYYCPNNPSYRGVFQCAAGTCCAGGAVVVCGPGQYCPRAFGLGCNLTALACPPGYYCPDGKTKKPCSAGTVQPLFGQAKCSKCVGSSTPNTSRTKCKPKQSRRGTVTCPRFHYCVDGVPIPCPKGYFCNAENLDDYTDYPCPAGKFCPLPATSFPVDCGWNRACDVGSAFPTSCSAGEYLQTRHTIDPTIAFANKVTYYVCVDCYPGRYCQGDEDVPKQCPNPGWCPLPRTCWSGSKCNVMNRLAPKCTADKHAICDRAFEVREGRTLSVDGPTVTVELNYTLSELIVLDPAVTVTTQVTVAHNDSQLAIKCTNESELLQGVEYFGSGGALMIIDCLLDGDSISIASGTGPSLIVLGSGVVASFDSLDDFVNATILLRTGAVVSGEREREDGSTSSPSDTTAGFVYIRDDEATYQPTLGPVDWNSQPSQPPVDNTLQNFNSVIAVSVTMVAIGGMLLTLLSRRLVMWRRKRGLTRSIMPGRTLGDDFPNQQRLPVIPPIEAAAPATAATDTDTG